jgi:hypothetical protein
MWLWLGLACGDPAALEDAPTWNGEISPLLQRHCTRCHGPGGGAPLDFTDRALAESLAPRMLARIDAGEMPPPVSDPACRDYVGSDHLSLDPAARDLLAAWVDADFPIGEPTRGSSVAPPGADLEDADLVLRLPAPYQPTFQDAANPANEYRCFALDHGQDEAFYITAMGAEVDETRLVHHIVVYVDQESDIPEHDPALGWDCINGNDAVFEGMVTAWAPGALPVAFAPGTGFRVEPGERLVLQMHYYQNGEGLTDQSGYRLQTAPSVSAEAYVYPFGDTDFLIPAGDADARYTYRLEVPETIDLGFGQIPYPDTLLYRVLPHMHVLGKSYDLKIVHPDGQETCLVSSEHYDFDNQLDYTFREPATLRAGDTIVWTCRWDNSLGNPDLIHDPPIDVGYGERTDEEMCFAFTTGSVSL